MTDNDKQNIEDKEWLDMKPVGNEFGSTWWDLTHDPEKMLNYLENYRQILVVKKGYKSKQISLEEFQKMVDIDKEAELTEEIIDPEIWQLAKKLEEGLRDGSISIESPIFKGILSREKILAIIDSY